ncbi:MAG: hypothetical protein AB7E47_05575 [Desulfovibrionaceae bacterium]
MRIIEPLKQTFTDTLKVCRTLYAIMIPIILVVKVLQELSLIQYCAAPLTPIMHLVGLPANMGLVWATAIMSNLYAAIVVYAALIQHAEPLTVAQITTLCTMMLIAHNMPLELKIAQKSGVSLRGQLALRMLGAIACGMLLHHGFAAFGMFGEPSALLWQPEPDKASLLAWGLDQIKNLGKLFFVIWALMGLMRLLGFLRITDLFLFFLSPVLRFMGVGRSAATITVVGLTLGLAYGGGLIIHESKTGKVARNDLFASISLMSLSHALVEDTILMMVMGANMVGTFWARLLFSLLVVAVLTRLYNRFYPLESSATA